MNDFRYYLLFMLGVVALLTAPNVRSDQPDTPAPCKCLNYYEWQYYSTKRDSILEALETGRLHRRKQLTDSLNKYNKILGI